MKMPDQSNRWVSLYQASHEMSASLNLEELYAAIHNAVAKVMPCDDFIIDGYDEATNEVVPLYLIEPPRQRIYPPRYIADHGLAGTIIHTGKSFLLNSDKAIAISGIKFEMYGSQIATHSLVAVPMRLRGKVIGMLSAQSYDRNAYTVEDQEMLEMLASHAAITLENVRMFLQIKQLADADPLTGIFNRRKFFELAGLEFSRAMRYRNPLSAIMMDIDRFKHFNNSYGHKFGDWVLKIVVELCCRQLRSVDVFGRYGGEEFALILPSTDLRGAEQVAERLRAGIEQIDEAAIQKYTGQGFSDPNRPDLSLKVTLSLGVAALDPSCDSVEALIEHADQALYWAKHAGRNRVKIWPAVA